MALPELLIGDGAARACALAERWKLDLRLAHALLALSTLSEREYGYRWQIISGYRTPEHQRRLKAEGRPAIAVDLSTHTACPAIGADVWPAITPVRSTKAQLGQLCLLVGLRWGGGSSKDELGIPSDWNHVDLGSRAAMGV